MPAIERRLDTEHGLLLAIMTDGIVCGSWNAVARQFPGSVNVGKVSAQRTAAIVAQTMGRER
jgi:hypothetical protein